MSRNRAWGLSFCRWDAFVPSELVLSQAPPTSLSVQFTSQLEIAMSLLAHLGVSLLLVAAPDSPPPPPPPILCSPLVAISRTPCLGESFTLTTDAAAGCGGSTFFSFNLGPISLGGINGIQIPVGPPADWLFGAMGKSSMRLKVPWNRDFLELDVHFFAVYSDGRHLEVSNVLSVRACQ